VLSAESVELVVHLMPEDLAVILLTTELAGHWAAVRRLLALGFFLEVLVEIVTEQMVAAVAGGLGILLV
jgi:hypothetical protein